MPDVGVLGAKPVGRPALAGLAPGVVTLLALSIFINYVDRGNLATAAPLMKDQLHLDNTQIGLLLSAFFWTYTPGQILSGLLAEKINAYRTLALGLAIWAAATALSGLVSSFAILIGRRLMLGLGESAAFPCSSKLLAEHLPRDKLGAANGLIGVGLALGPAFGIFFGGLIMNAVGWRPMFVVTGALSALWLIPWFMRTRGSSRAADVPRADATSAPSFIAIIGKREAWGAALGHFSANYAFYFVISWLPLYLIKARGFSVTEMGQLGGIIYVVYAISAQVTGWVSDRWMAAGASDTLVRKTFAAAAHVGGAACMLACALAGPGTPPAIFITALLVAGVCFGFNTPNIFAFGQTLAGPRAGGKWIGFQNCIGNLAGIVAPIITGVIIDKTGQYFWAFLIAAAVGLTGVIGWVFIIRRVEPVDWDPT
jgi:MFS family permease